MGSELLEIIFCCNKKEERISNAQNEEYSISEIDKNIIYDKYNSDRIELDEYEYKKNEILMFCIDDLKTAEKEANEIINRAKKNRAKFLETADEAAKEIVKPYYNMACDELKEMEISLNKELHIKTLEVLLSKNELEEEPEITEKVNETVSTVLSKVCEVSLNLQNSDYIYRQLNKHKIKSETRRGYRLKEKFKSLTKRISNIKEEKKSHINNKRIKIKLNIKNDEQISTSTIELDENYSKIDNMYGGSRIVSSFNTIHIN
ncbi:hypothetical protein FG386_002616 [Cryptosporidium ryanae]|uniref:uncharacterized protein n=1 Tax=Cryptosporidium ryanae TaxID=515981 RepID=UPI00351A89F8|nr:hypothetical protein FG386_002616 [Cryptosporidium ryanae]